MFNTPQHLKFGGGLSESAVHPAVLMILLCAIPLILFMRRDRLSGIVLPLGLLVPYAQQFVFGGVHLLIFRIVILAGIVRALSSGGWKKDGLQPLFLTWAITRVIAFLLTYQATEAIVSQCGFLWDAVGGFFLFRYLIQDHDDVQRAIRILAGVGLVVAVCMLNEHITGVNVFGYIGGVPTTPAVRSGSIRAQGPFAHSLLAGTFGASLLPLFALLWMNGKSRFLAAVGAIASVVITVLSASSTPVMAICASIAGICLWPVRDHMRILRWGFLSVLAALALVMKAPIWFILARIDLTGGSSGYHRAVLIDQWIRHFGDWWLIGTAANGSWGWDLWDTCNQFVTEGQTGGLFTLLCFVAILVKLFQRLTRARKASGGDTRQVWYYWLLAVTLFTHCVAFWGIVYFDLMLVMWYALLAMLIAATSRDANVAVIDIAPKRYLDSRAEWVAARILSGA